MFIDTSAIVELLEGSKASVRIDKILQHIKDEPLFISVVQLAELSDWCESNKIDSLKRISQIRNITNVIPLNDNICMTGAEIKHEMRKCGIDKFSLIDGLILASARSINQKLLSADTDYRRAKDVIVVG
jgi:predicted nucleic acid-binding protein